MPAPKNRRVRPAGRNAAATLTIHHASEMTPKGRREIAQWLRDRAACLVKNGKEYSARFTGRYLY